MNEILSIVQRLDTSRAQVLIEAAIVEITLTDNLSAGIEMAGADSTGKNVPLVSTALGGGLAGSLANLGNTDGTFNQNVLTSLGTTTQPTIAAARIDLDGISFGAFVTALASMENANLLSTPSIVTLDNTEAKFLLAKKCRSDPGPLPPPQMVPTILSPR